MHRPGHSPSTITCRPLRSSSRQPRTWPLRAAGITTTTTKNPTLDQRCPATLEETRLPCRCGTACSRKRSELEERAMKAFAGMFAMILLLGAACPVAAQDSTEALYKAKCQICHGADATGSPVGKKLGVKDFQSPEVQKQTEPELLAIARKGQGKMPAYDGKISSHQLTDLIKYMRGLAKSSGKGN